MLECQRIEPRASNLMVTFQLSLLVCPIFGVIQEAKKNGLVYWNMRCIDARHKFKERRESIETSFLVGRQDSNLNRKKACGGAHPFSSEGRQMH